MDQHRYFFPASPIFLLILCFLITFTACIDDQAYLTADVSINCGSSGVSATRNGREWMGETHPVFTSSLQLKGTSTVSSVIRYSISDDPIPYKTARISRSSFTYTFLLNPGQKFIRLHFNPTPYKGFKRLKDLFNVEAGPFILLSNFSASITADALGLSFFTKEFCISIQENQPLNIIFSPATSQQSQDAYAFINGIEIIPVPLGHSYFHDEGIIGAQVVGHKSQLFYIDNTTALELVHQVNIKRNLYYYRDMFGMWATDPSVKANGINNITQKISVDVGFRYLVRLHFSELGHKMAETGAVIFKVLINEMIADTNIDIGKERDTNGIFKYKDYMVMMKGHKEEGKRDLLVSLKSFDQFLDGYGPFMGFEIFKLSNTDNSLASPNPLPPARDSSSCTVRTLVSIISHRNAIATVAITIFALVNIIVHKLREIWEASRTEEENKPSARAEKFCSHFSLAEIQLATRNFSDSQVIGKGGFGKVYKGLIDDGREIVAIKRLKPDSRQGAHEFLAEIETLSELRHINLVALIGYCNENREMILVYEYMACGTLADHLYKLARKGNSCSTLTWKQRLNICIGAGRGLDYLHTGHAVIHRDVKVSNILLDENFTAKVSDFGLVKHENRSNLQSHVSTKVKGTFGYIDPNYFSTGKLTRKSDTYAFGVVLLEVLCGRPALDPSVASEEQILTKWARDKISKGEVYLIVESSLRGEILPDSLKAFVEVVERCLDEEPKKRPTMAQVVLQLEFALEQQATTTSSVPNEITSVAPCSDETNLLVSEKPTMASTEEQTLTSPLRKLTSIEEQTFIPSPREQTSIEEQTFIPPPREQTDRNMDNVDPPSGRRDGRYKPTRIWPWDALWNRVKPSKKNESSIIGAKLPKFDWNTIVSATNQFSSFNKIGQGGFGPVYKALFPTGQIVAVKRLLTFSTVSHSQFENEILLLQNLQHRNIVKLIGYCIHKEERILVYEFMENGSLDAFIFGEEGRSQLEWTQRFKIIMGIARGILYLHQDSGSTIIHRDPKTSNILLDNEMNPKISDFGLARSLQEYHSDVFTMVAGTLGYISPESIQYGIFSSMSDLYTFGVVVLEIVSGKRSYELRRDDMNKDLVKFAWKLWNDGKVLDLVDDLMKGTVEEEALRCIQVGMLCTQEQPHVRPTISTVLDMLDGKELVWL